MTDKKGDKITKPNEPQATTPVETQLDTDPQVPLPTQAQQSGAGDKLSNLMAEEKEEAARVASARGAAAATPDLDAEALLAAEQALSKGERALAEARASMSAPAARAQPTPSLASQSQSSPAHRHAAPPAPIKARRGRELALRLLLAVNVLAMIVVSALPEPAVRQDIVPTVAPFDGGSELANAQQPAAKRFNEPWNQAMAAADRRDFHAAVEILEQYLVDAPRMAPSQKLNVLMTLAHYAGQDNDFKKAEEFQRRAEAIDQSHSLPEDLVEMAKAAIESGDQETLRRIWARFLLQQRQIPSWLYKHVAEAYLQLGDSYRRDADVAAERARRLELQQAAARLREESTERPEKPR